MTIFELVLVGWSFISLILCFPLFKNPVSMVGALIGVSLYYVSMISFFSSFWFSYVLFLVYVGGLLVLFIYICLVSSNYPFKFSFNSILFVGSISLVMSIFNKGSLDFGFLGSSTWINGEELLESSNISIFLFLGILLLTMLLVVVRISGAGCFTVGNEKS